MGAAALPDRLAISEFPKIRGPFLEVLTIRIIVSWGLFWCPLFLETPLCRAASRASAVSEKTLAVPS